MGLDQFACIENENKLDCNDIEIAYWRKHNRLQGWMDKLWHDKGNVTTDEDKAWGSSFNGQKLYLTLEDIKALEIDVLAYNLPKTEGFFFGSDSYGYSNEMTKYDDFNKDIDFIKEAKELLHQGKTIYYQCSW